MGAVDTVEGEVRELVRRRGLDPSADPLAVRRLVDEVITDYDERTLSSSLPRLPDPRSTARQVYDAVAGFGPLQRYLDDPRIEEIWINEPGRVFVAKRGRSELTTTILSAGQVEDLVEKMLKSSGRRVDLSTPFVDAMLPDGSRLHVVIPDITRRHMAVNVRKFILTAHSLDELVGLGTLTSAAARFLEAAVVSGLNIIVAGGTQAGKTTFDTEPDRDTFPHTSARGRGPKRQCQAAPPHHLLGPVAACHTRPPWSRPLRAAPRGLRPPRQRVPYGHGFSAAPGSQVKAALRLLAPRNDNGPRTALGDKSGRRSWLGAGDVAGVGVDGARLAVVGARDPRRATTRCPRDPPGCKYRAAVGDHATVSSASSSSRRVAAST